MLKNLLFGFLALLSGSAYSQKITGTVFDKLTGNAIPFASVFLNGSSSGTLTGRNGDFLLLRPENQILPIVASSPGCEIMVMYEYPRNAHIHFFMNPQLYALGEAMDSKNSRDQKRAHQVYMEIFKNQFLGKSVNGASCKILNEKDLILKNETRSDIISARCDKPLIIENASLGYRITYIIDKFEFTTYNQTLSCIGYYTFKELPGLQEQQLAQAEKKRRLAYFGSRLEFFRSLWNNCLDSAGYELRNTSNNKLNYDSLVYENGNGSKFWKYLKPVRIYHFSKNSTTTMRARDSVYFDRLGYYDNEGLDWWISGELTFQKIGDLLPVDYLVK